MHPSGWKWYIILIYIYIDYIEACAFDISWPQPFWTPVGPVSVFHSFPDNFLSAKVWSRSHMGTSGTLLDLDVGLSGSCWLCSAQLLNHWIAAPKNHALKLSDFPKAVCCKRQAVAITIPLASLGSIFKISQSILEIWSLQSMPKPQHWCDCRVHHPSHHRHQSLRRIHRFHFWYPCAPTMSGTRFDVPAIPLGNPCSVYRCSTKIECRYKSWERSQHMEKMFVCRIALLFGVAFLLRVLGCSFIFDLDDKNTYIYNM